MNINKICVLNLNSCWQRIGKRSIADAFVAMTGGAEGNPPVKAIDIVYPQDKDGNFLLDEEPDKIPVSWTEWLALPIYPHHEVVNTAKLRIRVPTVVVCLNYGKMPKKELKHSKRTLYDLQGGRCGYSYEPINYADGNVEHVTPVSFGGKTTFDNTLFVKKELNSLRGNKPLEEVGLRPRFKHSNMPRVPISSLLKENYHNDWRWF